MSSGHEDTTSTNNGVSRHGRAGLWTRHFFTELKKNEREVSVGDLLKRLKLLPFTEEQVAKLVNLREHINRPSGRGSKFDPPESQAAEAFLKDMHENSTFPLSAQNIINPVERSGAKPETQRRSVVPGRRFKPYGPKKMGDILLRLASMRLKSTASIEDLKKFLLDVWLPPYQAETSIEELLKTKFEERVSDKSFVPASGTSQVTIDSRSYLRSDEVATGPVAGTSVPPLDTNSQSETGEPSRLQHLDVTSFKQDFAIHAGLERQDRGSINSTLDAVEGADSTYTSVTGECPRNQPTMPPIASKQYRFVQFALSVTGASVGSYEVADGSVIRRPIRSLTTAESEAALGLTMLVTWAKETVPAFTSSVTTSSSPRSDKHNSIGTCTSQPVTQEATDKNSRHAQA